MFGLLIIAITGFAIFSYVTIFKFHNLKRIEPFERVKYAREQMKLVSVTLVKAVRAKIEVIYEDKNSFEKLNEKDGLVFISNHSSNLDIPLLITAIPMDLGFVAKKEMQDWIFFGKWMKETRCAFLDRVNPREGIKGIKYAAETVKDGHPILIFPQGTRKKEFGDNEFKKGSFKLATDVGGYIVPITIIGSDTIQEPGEKKVKLNQNVKIHIGKPINLQELSSEELKNINEVTEGKIRETYNSFKG